MARESVLRCDICRKVTNKIVGKLRFTPTIPGVHRQNHNLYTHHLDVGECCKDKIFNAFHWRKRTSMKEYQNGRKRSQVIT